MSSIREQKIRGQSYYYLDEPVRDNGKVRHIRTYLGTKSPIPKNMARTSLPDNWVERLKRKAAQKSIKPTPNPTLPEGKFSVIYADPPWRYDFSETEPRSIEAHYNTLDLEEICNYKDSNGTPVQGKFADCLNVRQGTISKWGKLWNIPTLPQRNNHLTNIPSCKSLDIPKNPPIRLT